jgi:lipoprotein NlpD
MMMRFPALLLLAVLAGCAARQPAPVIDRAATPAPRTAPGVSASPQPRVADVRPNTYVVKRGDTLFSIALDNGQDYRELAQWNNLTDPNRIQVGQELRLRAPEGTAQVSPIRTPGSVESRPLAASGQSDALKTEPRAGKRPYSEENLALMQRGPAEARPQPSVKPPPPVQPQAAQGPDEEDKVDWSWPASGRVIAGFSEATNKGIDIAGKSGDTVVASAAGRVVYSGQGLRGYGKLIIIKHNNTFLSAYAHNKEILVKEGQNVVKGQKIAEVGNTDADQPKLHFEIRRLGKPVDPAKFLPDRPS